jgi:hypothetical protein
MSLPPYSAGFLDKRPATRAVVPRRWLLARGLGGALRITRKGREVVKSAARDDQEVADALQEALRSPLLSRREKVSVAMWFGRAARRRFVVRQGVAARTQEGTWIAGPPLTHHTPSQARARTDQDACDTATLPFTLSG